MIRIVCIVHMIVVLLLVAGTVEARNLNVPTIEEYDSSQGGITEIKENVSMEELST